MAAYYHQVTTATWPMGALLALVMLATVASALLQFVRNQVPRPAAIAALLLCAVPVALALGRILPNATRLGARSDSLDVQSELARSICYDHLFCFVSIGLFLALQMSLWSAHPRRGGTPGGFSTRGIPR